MKTLSLVVLSTILGVASFAAGDNPAASEATPTERPATPTERPGEEEPRPELSIADARYSWGTAFRGERLEHTFVVKNSGTAPLVIEEVKPQCGCTLAAEYEKTLQSGQSTSLSLTLETGAMSGKKEKYTQVISNALTEDNKLWMEGEIVELLTLDPKMPRVEAVLGTRIKPAPTPLNLTLNLPDRKVEILGVKTRDGKLTAKLAKTPSNSQATAASPKTEAGTRKNGTQDGAQEEGTKEEAKQSYLVHLRPQLADGDRTAFQDEALQVQVRVDGKPLDLSFPISVALRDRIQVSPSRSIHFSAKDTEHLTSPAELGAAKEKTPPKEPPHKLLDIRSIGDPDHEFKILGVEESGKHFRTKLETVTPGKHYRLRVFVVSGPEGRKRFVRDRFRLKTDDPEVPILNIPAMAQFARKRR